MDSFRDVWVDRPSLFYAGTPCPWPAAATKTEASRGDCPFVVGKLSLLCQTPKKTIVRRVLTASLNFNVESALEMSKKLHGSRMSEVRV
jgi:hypothetical protein